MKQEAKQNIKPLLVIGVGVLALVISGYQIATGAHGSPFVVQNEVQKQNASAAKSAAAAQKDLSENVDSDGDGLTDNQESQIYHTNPFSTDTDHDGHNDIEEIKAGYDPNVADPNSTVGAGYTNPYRYDTTLGKSSQTTGTVPSADSKDTGSSASTDSSGIGAVANLMAANQAITGAGDLPEVKDSEIVIAPIGGKPGVERYIASYAAITITTAPFTSQDDAKNFITAAVSGDVNKVNQLVAKAKDYEKAMLELPVPSEMISIHKRTIGSTRLLLQTTKLFSDPGSLSSDEGFKVINQVEGLMNVSDEIVQDIIKTAQKYNINLNTPIQ